MKYNFEIEVEKYLKPSSPLFACPKSCERSKLYQRPSTMVRVRLFTELQFWLCWEELVPVAVGVSRWMALTVNADCFGSGSSTTSLHSIDNTAETDGLSVGSAWTHSNPMCMHLISSARWLELDILVSITAVTLSSFHSFHTCSFNICQMAVLEHLMHYIKN